MPSESVISLSTMNEKYVTHRPYQWVYPATIQTEDEFHTYDEIPFVTTPDATSFTTIKKQVRKKSVSKKSKKDRISAKSFSLSERLGYQPYKQRYGRQTHTQNFLS